MQKSNVLNEKNGGTNTMAGTQCCENPPTQNSNSGDGRIEEIGVLKSYVSGSTNSTNAVILLSDIFGYEAPNFRKFADKVAAAGYYVVVPDYFHGDPYNPNDTERPVLVWVKEHGHDKGYEETKPVIEALKQKGLSKIGAAGFCWGDVKVPLAILGAEIDHMSPPKLVLQFGEALKAKPEIDSFVKIFPGVLHGWSVRYNPEDLAEVKAAEEALQDTLSWLQKHVS